MAIAFWITLTVLVLAIWPQIWQAIVNRAECEVAREFVKSACEPDVDDRFLAGWGSLGVHRSARFVTHLDDDRSSLILVQSHFQRGGYREHDCVYMIAVDRKSKSILKCVSVASHSPATIVCDKAETPQASGAT